MSTRSPCNPIPWLRWLFPNRVLSLVRRNVKGKWPDLIWGFVQYGISVRNAHLKIKSRSSITSVAVVETLHTAWQYPCRAQCKMSTRLGICKTSYGQTRFRAICVKMRFGRTSHVAQPPDEICISYSIEQRSDLIYQMMLWCGMLISWFPSFMITLYD